MSSYFPLFPLDNEATVMFLHSAVSLKRHPIRFPHTQIFLDRVLPDSELLTSETMRLGGQYIPIVGVNDFPDETYPAILDGLNRARLEYRWVTRYICLDKEEGKKEAQKKEKAHRGSRKTFFQTLAESTSGEATRAVNHGAGVKEQDSIGAGIEIETDVAALGYLSTNVMVFDPILKDARKKADMVKTIVNSAGFTCKEETFNALEAWKSMLPGNVYSNYRALPVMTNTMAHVVPLSSVWAGFRHNDHAAHVSGVGTPHVICSTLEGTPFFLNLAVGDVGHTAIWGPAGAGKSTLLNLLEMQFFKYPGSMVIAFDKGRSCRQPCLSVGGLFYEPAGENSSAVSFQPLSCLETDRDLLDAIDFIEACIAVNGGIVTPPLSSAIKEGLELLRELPRERRTMTSFLQYAHYYDPVAKRPVLEEMLGDYLIDGGKYGKIFDGSPSAISQVSTDTRFLAIEMEALMNRGEGCVVPALVYLFNLVEKKFDGRLILLVLDEAWLFLKNVIFADKIAEWLKVLRKKNVYVVFATQDIADVANSPLKSNVIQQCLTKIYLANLGALVPGLMEVYADFGLTESEIGLLAAAEMKRDYFYTSPAGRRLFQLDLGKLTLALVGTPDHALLDGLASHFQPGVPLCAEMLAAKRIAYPGLLGDGTPVDPPLALRGDAPASADIPMTENLLADPGDVPVEDAVENSKIAGLLDAVASLPERKKNDGSGRAAASISMRFKVSMTTVYQARRVLKHGSPELVEDLRSGKIPVKTAYRMIDRHGGAASDA